MLRKVKASRIMVSRVKGGGSITALLKKSEILRKNYTIKHFQRGQSSIAMQ